MEADQAANEDSRPRVLDRENGAGGDAAGWIFLATWLFVALGVLIRLVRFLVDYPIWHDEAFLAVNFWDRDYVDLLRPLDYGQIAPWFFLVIERTVVIFLGYSEQSLRLFPTICSVLSVPLFRHVAGRLLGGKAALVAVAVFATSFYPIRHGAEIKPYASDLLAALILLALALEVIRSPRSNRWWWVLVAIAPILIALSYPAVFIAGGIGLALAPAALRSGRRPVRLRWMIYNIIVLASFVSVYLACTVVQATAMRDEYRNGCWADAFPPLDRPWAVPIWLLDVHAGNIMGYPIGERHGGGAASLCCVVAGCLALYQQGRKQVLAVLTAPFGLGLVAAFLGRYPYGGAPRVMQYLAPSICLLMGLGAMFLLSHLPQFVHRHRAFLAILAALTTLGGWLVARDLAKPYRVIGDVHTREFARWFWSDRSRGGELACLKSDIGLVYRPHIWRAGMSAVYLFHQRMFLERLRRGDAVDLDPQKYSDDRPLRLVAFDQLPSQDLPLRPWLAAMGRTYEPRQIDTYVITASKPGEEWLRDAYVVLELVPRRDRVGSLVRGSGSLPSGRRF
jgi:hypothetical protein